MRKILFSIFMFLSACSQNETTTLKTGTYKLTDSMHNALTTISFSDDGRVTAKVVNIIMGQYKTNGDNITINPTGTTMMIGPEKDMDAEQNFIQALVLIKKYKTQGNNLVLILENGGELIFEPYIEPKE